ncbi:MAG: hypothetical protein CSA24_02545 [Deltaproteobacteria bacterium]|nr:MAG: hypothetical protein CSA24_02545 [Deltaproteobacteria bacterium]
MRAPRQARAGFSLVEAVVAMGMLGMLMVGVASSQGDSMYRAVEVMNLTNATQLVESVVLNLEEEYRLDGFPTNQVEGRDCSDMLPKGFDKFECRFDLLMIELDADAIGSLGAEANENVQGSDMMSTFCGQDGQALAANIPAICSQLAAQGGGVGLPPGLQAFAPLCDPGLSEICGVNIGKMCQNTMMISMVVPTIIEVATASTRKLRVHISWDDDGLVANDLTIETFVTAVPDAEEEP